MVWNASPRLSARSPEWVAKGGTFVVLPAEARAGVEANEAKPSAFPTPDMLTGKKMAYNDVLQFARKQLADRSGQP